jgi:sugar phosphate permease
MSLLAILAFLALVGMVAAFAIRKAAIAFASGAVWLLAGLQARSFSIYPLTGTWDIYYGLFMVCCGLVLLCVLEPAIMRQKKEDVKDDITVDEIDEYEKEWSRYNKGTRVPRIRRE